MILAVRKLEIAQLEMKTYYEETVAKRKEWGQSVEVKEFPNTYYEIWEDSCEADVDRFSIQVASFLGRSSHHLDRYVIKFSKYSCETSIYCTETAEIGDYNN